MWLIKRDIIDVGILGATRTILGLDAQEALDNVKHEAILNSLREIGVGKWAYSYITAFLGDRTTTFRFGGINNPMIYLGTRRTTQGAALSPFLFKCTMKNLMGDLNNIKLLRHAIYTDDVTT